MCLELWPVVFLNWPEHCCGSPRPLLRSQSGVFREFKHEVKGWLLQNLALCPSRLHTECRALRAERVGGADPAHAIITIGQGIKQPPESSTSLPPTPTQGEGKQLPPEPMLVKFSTQHRTNISGEPEGIWHQNQVEKGEIAGVTEPGFGGDGLG